MAVIGREAARAPLTSADINDGIVGAADLQSTLDLSSKTITMPSIASLDVTGNLTVDTSTLHVDATNNRVGIGTTSPGAGLHVETDTNPVARFSRGTNNTANVNWYYNTTLTGQLGAASSGFQISAIGATIPMEFYVNGAERMRITSAGNVGIGTASPDESLVVNGGIKIRGTNYLSFTNTSDQTYIRAPGSNILAFGTDTAERMRIDSSGLVGIGTSSPSSLWGQAYQLVVGGGAGNIGMSIYGASTGNSRIAFVDTTAGTPGLDSGGLISYSHVNDAFDFRVAGSEAMRITSAGNVGINTSSPNFFGSGTKGITVNGSSGSHLEMLLNGASLGFLLANSNGLQLQTNSNNPLIFGTNNSEAMRIDSSGRLLIGTTDTFPGNGDTNVGIALTHLGNAAFSSDSNRSIFNRNLTDGSIIEFNKDGTAVGSIGTNAQGQCFLAGSGGSANGGIGFYSAGVIPTDNAGAQADNSKDMGAPAVRWDDIYATNGTIQTSDANEKQDIAELDEAERRVAVAAKSLLRKFRWKDSVAEKGDDARIHFGIIAQDLQAAFEAEGLDAGRYAMFIHSTWTDEETGEERSRMGVRYSELLAFIIAAL